MAMKPAGVGARQWRQLGRIQGGVEIFEEPEGGELTVTPFGLRSVKTVAERAYLKGGAKKRDAAALGSLSVETGKAVKQKVGKGMGKKQARRVYGYGGYDYDTSQPEARALAQATGVG